MTAHHHPPQPGRTPSVRRAGGFRLAALLAGAAIAFLLQTSPSDAQSPACPIEGCTWKVAPECGVCYTINGYQVMYKKLTPPPKQ